MSQHKIEAVLSVRITPGARRNAVSAFREGVWHIKIAAPPVEGRANDELVAYLGRLLDVRRGAISVVKGHASRSKLVSVSGLTGEDISIRLTAQLKG
jgi:uncharacterized protein (TIGR00251 family)